MLHIGSARTALYNYLFARHTGGALVLRVDDTDAARSEAALEAAIMADLRWLGIEWDEGPDVGGPAGPYRQQERLERYRVAAGALLESGRAYRCFCPEERLEELRREALAAGRTPRYDRRCLGLPPDEAQRRVAAGEPAAVRFRVPAGEVVIDDLIRGHVTIEHAALSDPIIVRSDGVAGYNFASVVDDLAMGITHVIRGDDHLTNTARQQLLYEALGGPVPRFAHHSMVLGPDGGKLSKRHGAAAVGDYRDLGYLPSAIVNYLALLGWSHGEDEVLGMERLVAEFVPEKLSASPAIFDLPKLDWLDHEHIMALAPEEHERLFAERLPAATPPRRPRRWRRPSSRRWCGTARRRRWPRRCSSRPPRSPIGPSRSPPPPRPWRGCARFAWTRRSGSRPRPPATCSPPTAPGARIKASARATCSCRCASP